MERITTEQFLEGMDWKEKKVFADKLQAWLQDYTQECWVKVMEQFEDIINNEMAMMMIDELYQRQKEETEDEARTLDMWMGNVDHFKQFDPHNHCLTHSGSYRNILYDMYIRNK